MDDGMTRKAVLCDLYCKLSKSIEYLSGRSTTKYSGASVVSLLKEIQAEVERAMGAAE